MKKIKTTLYSYYKTTLDFITNNKIITVALLASLGFNLDSLRGIPEPVQQEIVVQPTQAPHEHKETPHTHDKHPHPFAGYKHKHAELFNWINSEIGRLERRLDDQDYKINNLDHPH